MKLTKTNAIVMGLFLSLSLFGCASANKNEESQNTPQTIISEESYQKEISKNNIEEEKDEEIQSQPITQEEAQENIEEEIDSIEDEINELNNSQTEEDFETKKEKAKDKVRKLKDFLFNGEDINGYTKDDLTEEAKRELKQNIEDLDEMIDEQVPNYKERFHDWTVEKGADAKELWEGIKEEWNQYKEEVNEEYNNRQVENVLKLIKK